MNKVLEVYQINSYIKQIFENDIILNEVFVQGEISNFKDKNHFYFTLKDDYSAINCVMFSSHTKYLNFKPENGMKVMVFGRISIYEKTGQYQIYTEIMQPAGLGALHLAFEQLKQKLNDEGLFDQEHKKKLPSNPQTIALITSTTGAVVQDMISIAKRRNPSINLLVVPTLVQGDNASSSISQSLYDLAEYGQIDIAILARGGGSSEDLSAFNHESVARAIFHFPLPIISAIGHETDFTISDFVADLRASTPSSAIEVAIPDSTENMRFLNNKIKFLNNLMVIHLSTAQNNFSKIKNNPSFSNIDILIKNKRNYFESLTKTIDTNIETKVKKKQNKFAILITILDSNSPLKIMSKGYSTIYKNNKIVKTKNDLYPKDQIKINLIDGQVNAIISND